MSDALRICIGYDQKEAVAFQVLSHSLLSRASRPIAIIPVAKQLLRRSYSRPRVGNESTDFSITRFLSPMLCGYEGLGIFMDCDMLCRVDIFEVLREVEQQPGKAVWVCQHDYTPKPGVKFLGQPQAAYPMKNWSSFMVFDAGLCRALTPDYVNAASGMDLHRFHWLPGENLIGSLPLEWNWLVGEYQPNIHAKVLHYTLGTPCFENYRRCDHAGLWLQEFYDMVQPMARLELTV